MLRLAFSFLITFSINAVAEECNQDELRKDLLAREDADQAARKELHAAPDSTDALKKVLEVDSKNTSYMRDMLGKCGWPADSVVGKQAAKAAWLLTQHADMDPQYQILAIQKMKYSVLAHEADAWNFAVLVDRNRRLNDQLQTYGMQYFLTDSKRIHFYDIVNSEQLDARREEIGLDPFYCWAMKVSKVNGNAPIEWPSGVLFSPVDCASDH